MLRSITAEPDLSYAASILGSDDRDDAAHGEDTDCLPPFTDSWNDKFMLTNDKSSR